MSSFYVSHFQKRLPRLPEPTPLKVIGYVNDDISGDIEIKKLVEKNENDKKIIELFKTQLLLPINLRNKTLMARFGIDVSKNGLIDAWPSSTNASVKFHVNCYFPTDPSIHENARLAGTKSRVLGLFTEKSTGNTYYFYFPLSLNGVKEDGQLRLDNFGTLIYRDTGEPTPESYESYNLYHALFDHLMDRNTAQSQEFLRTKGMYSEVNGVTFTLPNHGIRVEAMVRNANNSVLNEVKQGSTSTPATRVSETQLSKSITPIGEDVDDPFTALVDILNKANPEVVEPPEENPAEKPEEKSAEDKPAEEKPAEEKPTEEKTVEEFLTSDPSEEDEAPKKKPSKKTAADPYESTYPIEDVLKEELLKGKSPFPQLGVRYPGYRIQFNYSAVQGYMKLDEANYVIQSIDKTKKLIQVVVHRTAHRTHIVKGKIDYPDLFERYNDEFILAGNQPQALKNMGSATDVALLKKRMGPFTNIKIHNFL